MAEKADIKQRRRLRTALVERRIKLGLTQRQVAGRMNVNQPWVCELENGALDGASVSTWQRYARAVGCRLILHVEPEDSDAD